MANQINGNVKRLIKNILLNKEIIVGSNWWVDDHIGYEIETNIEAYNSLKDLNLPRFKQWLQEEGLILVSDLERLSWEQVINSDELHVQAISLEERADSVFKCESATQDWVHVLNKEIDFSQKEWLETFLDIEGEVCWSKVKDQHHSLRGSLIGVVMTGVPSNVFLRDVWSRICPVTGLRYIGGEAGALRYEAWMSPKEASFCRIVTDNEELLMDLRFMGYVVELLPQRRNRSVGRSPGGKTAQLIEKWDE